MSDDVVKRTNDLLRLSRVLFAEFCKEHSVPPATAHNVPINDFFMWLHEDMSRPPGSELVPEMLAAAAVDYPVWENLMALPENPGMYVQFAVLWEQVCLSFRPPLSHEIRSVHVVALIRWEDGRMTPLSNFVPRELINEAGTFQEGDLCTCLRHACSVLAELVKLHGADGFHDKQSYLVSERVMHLMAKAIQTSIPTMQAEAGSQMQSLLDIVFSYINPPALAIVEHLRATRKQASGPPQLGGGWDG
jgi:hypothetical protein